MYYSRISNKTTGDILRENYPVFPLYLRYDYNTLGVIRTISEICEIESYSDVTYRKKMRTIIQYVTARLMSEYMA